MSITRLFNHQVQVYREPDAVASRDTFGNVDAAPVAVGTAPTANNARPNQKWSGTLQDRGPGEQQAGLRQWFLAADLDVQERDVLNVLAGPEAGLLLRVLSVVPTTTGRAVVHHYEVNVEVWEGTLA